MKHLRKANLRYPGLWRGCVGAWAPLLGPSGTTLRDNSGFGNNGTLTNMDAATDWVVSGGKYALNFDGTNNVVSATAIINGPFTVACWCNTSVTGSFNNNAWNAGIADQHQLRFGPSAEFVVKNTTTWVSVTATRTLNTWEHYTCVCDATTLAAGSISIYRNGVLGNTTTTSTALTWSSTAFVIGAYNTSGQRPFTGQIDDVRFYNRVLSNTEATLLATRRGIAYETIKRRSYKSAAAPAGTTNNLMLFGVS